MAHDHVCHAAKPHDHAVEFSPELEHCLKVFTAETLLRDGWKAGCWRGRIGAVALASVALAVVAHAQSTRPGWGSTPYHDALGTGVTFRVWAPNATSVYVPGQFNNWSQTATPLGKELTNGVPNGVWSANVAGAVAGDRKSTRLNSSHLGIS